MRVRIGVSIVALIVGTYYLQLPSGLVLILNNCYYVPIVLRNLIYVFVLDIGRNYFSIVGGGIITT